MGEPGFKASPPNTRQRDLALVHLLLCPLSTAVGAFSSLRPRRGRPPTPLAAAADAAERPAHTPRPPWMRCVNAVAPANVRSLNEAVALAADVSPAVASDLVDIGAVWARLPPPTEDELLGQYYEDNPASASIMYADLPAGWGAGRNGLRPDDGEETLDEYVAREESTRYRRVMTPSTISPGTDLRVYPHPRRFPACYDFADPQRLLYEDTTFLVVDKPPMLPTQPEPSNYEECCPGCVNLLMGPFKTIDGEDVQRPLICHRVDSCVSGCLVLSKDSNGQRVFSNLQVSWDNLVAFDCATLSLRFSKHF